MKIRVIKTIEAANCPLGIATKKYLKDETYEIFDELAKVFIKECWGESIADKKEKVTNNKNDDELKTLRIKAKELNIKSSHIMGIDKLKQAIKAEKALLPLENKAITNLDNKNK